MNISIVKKSKDSISLFAFVEGKYYPLFQFEYRETEAMGGPAWYFWLRGDYNPDIFMGEKKNFPMDFFTKAVRAVAFIHYDINLDEEVVIVSGKNFLK